MVYNPSFNHPLSSAPSQELFITTLRIGKGHYHIYATLEDSQGHPMPLSPSVDASRMQKISALTTDLIAAHESKRISEQKADYALEKVNVSGLVLKGNAVISHDFLLQPASPDLAKTHARTLSTSACSLDPSTIKAQNLWSTLEATLKESPTPASLSPPSLSPPAINQKPASSSPLPISPTTPPPRSSPQTPAPVPTLSPLGLGSGSGPVLSTALGLKHHDFSKSDWFERIPNPRIQLRLCQNIGNCRGYYPVENKLWDLFQQRCTADGSLLSPSQMADRHRRSLIKRCEQLPSNIPEPIRKKGEAVADLLTTHVSFEGERHQIEDFIQAAYIDQNEKFLQFLREQALAEGVPIDPSDLDWAQNNLRSDLRRFLYTLERYLDNA